MTRRGILIILSSPSGAGKSSLARRLLDWDDSIQFSVSATTRKPRSGEMEGREYYFRSREEFEAMIAAGEMLEHAEVFGNLYGSPMGPVLEATAIGRDVIFDIDWQGGQQIRNSALAEDGRMQKSRDEISHWAEYDYCLVNRDIDAAEADLKAILTAERHRRSRQPSLVEFVRDLNSEFEERGS